METFCHMKNEEIKTKISKINYLNEHKVATNAR